MEILHINIEAETLKNQYYRRVIYTSSQIQIVLMYLAPGRAIGMETHNENDQFFRIEKGTGTAVIDGYNLQLRDGVALSIPKGTPHNIISINGLWLYTIYSPPHHSPHKVELY